MNRAIKFRAYDGAEWIYSSAVEYREEFNQWCIYDFAIGDWVYCGQPQQFTGLHDKSGAEVYEGDIVNCSKGCPHEVIWLEEHGGMFIGGMPAWYLSGLGEGYSWTGKEEVIGNVFENPELLEVPSC